MDRLSNLPDELLGHIISSLTTKEAVSTCVLSKSWEEIWVNLHNLDFYIPSYDHPFRFSFLDSDFIDEILRRLKSPEIGRFRLFCRRLIRPGVVARWISDAIRLKAYEIDFSVCFMELPSSFFSSDSLTVLKLSSNVCVSETIPEGSCFPNLKSMEFKVSNPPMELTKKLFRNCPKLEDLIIRGRIFNGGENYYDISSLSLRVLDIRLYSRSNYGPTPKVILNVPKIEHLHIENKCFVEYEVQVPLAPINASITVQDCCLNKDTEQDGNSAYTLLNGISGASSLVLNTATTYVLSKYYINNLPTLQHVTTLEVGIPRLCGWSILFSILEKSPNLEVLTIRKVCSHYEHVSPIQSDLTHLSEDFDWIEPHTPPNCLPSQLEIINFIGFFWMKCDMEVIKYLLGNAKVLKEVTFNPYITGQDGEADFWAELLDYAEASSSSNCEVLFENVEEAEWLVPEEVNIYKL